jgi:hypothetical protein
VIWIEAAGRRIGGKTYCFSIRDTSWRREEEEWATDNTDETDEEDLIHILFIRLIPPIRGLFFPVTRILHRLQ